MKRALIIAYYWPPAGGPGVQRWLKFVKYLPQFQIKPYVYIPENPSYPIIDKALIEEVSEEVAIVRFPIKEPYRLASSVSSGQSDTISKGIIPSEKKQSIRQRLLLFIRGNFFIPDARKQWVKPSVSFLSEYIIANEISTIITTGPPHSLHLIGLGLKKERPGIRWIADFRDPWTTIGYHKKLKLTPFARKKHKQLEKQVLNSADQLITTSFITKTHFEELTSKPVTVITNGYDDISVEALKLDSRFSISHIGTLLNDRNPEILWQVLQEIVYEDTTFRSSLQINLIGSVGREVIESLERHRLTQFLNLKGYVSHDEAVRSQRQSQLLLLVEIDSEETQAIIPGKLFEYMASNRPILALGPRGSDVEQLVKETNTGRYHHYDEGEALKQTIIAYFKAFMGGKLKSHGMGIQAYHRKNLTKQLSELILE
ncbi:MAG: glycosyl transferase family 1 [Flavobacteriaceae bacterium]|nr:glycosyl transferase family 1 [Flavobacteriaceae bacterium]